MKRLAIIAVILVAAIVLAYAAPQLLQPAGRGGVSAEVEALQDTGDTAGYARVYGPRPFVFPLDHGAHPEYQTEWWYYTGNLQAADGRHYGFQLTIFRRALTSTLSAEQRASDWATDQVYFAHFAITDVAGNRHTSVERFSRGAAGLAGAFPAAGRAEGEPFRVWIENWSATGLTPAADRVRLQAADGGEALDLTLTALKPPALQGDAGYSRKSEASGNASYYYSFTRLAAEGQVTVGGQPAAVTGLAWMDHEWSTSALASDVVGWDWFSIQLSDRRELMVYLLRRAGGGYDPASSGTLVEPDGGTRRLAAIGDLRVEASGTWKSPATGTEYPARWRLQVPGAGIDLSLEPWIPDQEMRVSFSYWEGAVRVTGTSNGTAVSGDGYVELTGYARPSRQGRGGP